MNFLASIGSFLIPFKLNLAYLALIPLIFLWAYQSTRLSFAGLKNFLTQFQHEKELKLFLIFSFSMIISSLFGLNIKNSLPRLSSLLFYPLLILVFWRYGSRYQSSISKFAIFGLTLACFLNLLRDSSLNLSTKFIGPVSQSGQIAIILFLVGAVYFSENQKANLILKKNKGLYFIFSIWLFMACLIVGFSNYFQIPKYWVYALLTVFFTSLILIINLNKNIVRSYSYLIICLPVMLSTFIVNMKRGPWLGVFVGLCLIAIKLNKKYFYLILIFFLSIASLLTPVQQRIIDAKDHFYISGGRSEIWAIGYDLVKKYPLGIGFENSQLLREFSITIPHNLKHFHNNLINITVEGGWLTGFLFIYLFLSFIRFFLYQKKPYTIWFAAGILSWFTAGLVEYNFGDSSVCNTLYIFIGLGLASAKPYPMPQSQN